MTTTNMNHRVALPSSQDHAPQLQMTWMTEKPKRKLTSYNFFFQYHRQLILDSLPENENRPKDSHGKVSFQDLAKLISRRWKVASEEEKAFFKQLEDEDEIRNKTEMAEWKRQQELAQRLNIVPPKPLKPTRRGRRGRKNRAAAAAKSMKSQKAVDPMYEPVHLDDDGTFFVNPFESPMERLARQLGDDGVSLVVRAFL